jgi:hypothetical protein
MSGDVPTTLTIINHRTPDLVDRAIGSVRKFYPSIPVLLIDNGSHDVKSVSVMTAWRDRFPQHTELLLNAANLHHGPAIDQAMRHASTPFLLFLDSDCEVLKGGFLEQMLHLASSSPLNYAIGKRTWMDRRGFDLSPGTAGTIPYIRPICMLVRRETYLSLPRAERHGAPCLANMREAARRGYRVIDFPVEDFVHHKGRGTASRFGYQLGWKGRLNHLLHKLRL